MLSNLIDIYRDDNFKTADLFQGAPIINSARLIGKIRDKENEDK